MLGLKSGPCICFASTPTLNDTLNCKCVVYKVLVKIPSQTGSSLCARAARRPVHLSWYSTARNLERLQLGSGTRENDTLKGKALPLGFPVLEIYFLL